MTWKLTDALATGCPSVSVTDAVKVWDVLTVADPEAGDSVTAPISRATSTDFTTSSVSPSLSVTCSRTSKVPVVTA